MNRKNIIIIALSFVCSLCLALAACNGNNDDKTIKNLSGDCGFTAEGEFEEGSTLVVQPLREVTDEQKAMIAAICKSMTFPLRRTIQKFSRTGK